jgi:F-type H+-transporting ATPase subunit epsilon
MLGNMKINIITPDENLYSGEVKDARLIGLDGHFEILNNHAPIVSALSKGEIKLIDNENQEHSFNINGGLLEMSNNKIQILAQ